MSKSIIREIFEGSVGNHEKMPESEKLNRYITKLWEYEELLKNALNGEQKALLELFNTEQNKIEYEREALAYGEGFRIGLLLGIECADEQLKNSNINPFITQEDAN